MMASVLPKHGNQEARVGNGAWNLILHNDDYNTFDWVIESLVEVCGHDPVQADQAAHLVHYKGRACVKTGDFFTISEMREKLIARGLSATVEDADEGL
jgi:ATP-dependent Clp protease adaptor protein ClpS